MKATWNNQTIAESDKTIEIEGNQYFPPDSVKMEFFKKSESHTSCPWKGLAHYYDITVDGEINTDAAWYYPETISDAAERIKGYIAFWHGVELID